MTDKIITDDDPIDTYFDHGHWMAHRQNYCGCGECNYPLGTGHTEAEAKASLLEQEEWREES